MIYLNYAALSPTRLEAQQEVEATLAEFKSLLYSRAGLDWYHAKISACRKDVADVLDVANPASIAFVPNASMASHLAFSFIFTMNPRDMFYCIVILVILKKMRVKNLF